MGQITTNCNPACDTAAECEQECQVCWPNWNNVDSFEDCVDGAAEMSTCQLYNSWTKVCNTYRNCGSQYGPCEIFNVGDAPPFNVCDVDLSSHKIDQSYLFK